MGAGVRQESETAPSANIPPMRIRPALGDVTGALGDLGVMVPMVAALVLVNGLDPGSILILAGCLVIAGLIFRSHSRFNPEGALARRGAESRPDDPLRRPADRGVLRRPGGDGSGGLARSPVHGPGDPLPPIRRRGPARGHRDQAGLGPSRGVPELVVSPGGDRTGGGHPGCRRRGDGDAEVPTDRGAVRRRARRGPGHLELRPRTDRRGPSRFPPAPVVCGVVGLRPPGDTAGSRSPTATPSSE
jgi:hypothetical protein